MIIMSVIVLMTAAIVHFSWQYASHNNIADMTEQLHDKITSNVSREISTLLGNASADIALIHQLMMEGVVDFTDVTSQERLFLATLQSNPTLSWVTFGFPNGDFFGTQRQGPKTFRSVARRWNPTTKLAKSNNRFFQQGDTGLMFTHSAIKHVPYFAPERAWYKSAVESARRVWTDVYIYASSQKPGIDVAMPLMKNGTISGVVAIGMELGQISDYLGQIEVGKTGISFIINKQSELIAYQDISEVVVTKNIGEKLQLGQLSSSRAPMLRVATQAIEQWDMVHQVHTEDHHQTVMSNGIEYIVTLVSSGHDAWLIGTVIPTKEFMDEVEAVQHQLLLLMGAAILLLAMLAYIWTRAFLVQPLLAITELATKIGQGHEWQEEKTLTSPIVEINRLTHTMKQMALDLFTMRTKEIDHSATQLMRERSLARLNQEMRQTKDVPSLCNV